MGLGTSQEVTASPAKVYDPVTMMACELRELLSALELRLSHPEDASAVGQSYAELSAWTHAHHRDPRLHLVLEYLEPENMYPEWRRQALEDIYVLFYEDIRKMGGAGALSRLPPPPLSYQQGILPEHATWEAGRGADSVSGWFESGSRFWRSVRWEYELRETNPVPIVIMPGGPNNAVIGKGREIVSKGRSARYCACAADPFCSLVGSIGGDREEVKLRSFPQDENDHERHMNQMVFQDLDDAYRWQAPPEIRERLETNVASVQRSPQIQPRLSASRSRNQDLDLSRQRDPQQQRLPAQHQRTVDHGDVGWINEPAPRYT